MATFMVTDYIVLSLVVLFIISGWIRGFIRSSIGPFAFATSALFSSLYFNLSKDVPSVIMFILIGTILLTVAGYVGLYFIRQAVPADTRDYTFWGSRLLGSLVTVFWRGTLLAVMLIFLTITPPTIFGLHETQEDIKKSASYAFIDSIIVSRFQAVRDVKEFLACLEDPERAKIITQSGEFKSLMEDPKMQELLNDPQIVEEINNKEAMRLVMNRKVFKLFNDKQFVRKFVAFSKVLYRSRNIDRAP